MKNYETFPEFEMTDEPENCGEFVTAASSNSDAWFSLAEVPFEGYSERNGAETSDMPNVDTAEISSEMPSEMPSETKDIISDIPEDNLKIDDMDANNEFPDKIPEDVSGNLSDMKSVTDVNDWLGDVNPNFDEFDVDSPYSNNCGSCAYAVYQRLEGNPDACASAENIPYNEDMEALTGMEQVSMDPSEIEQRLLEEGDGAHAIIGIDRAEGSGHWFNAACMDGKVVAIDGQTGEISDWPPDYGDVVNWEMSVKKG